MHKVSLAIPTYYSSQYLSIIIKTAIKSQIIDEIVITEDSNSDKEFRKVEKIVRKYQGKTRTLDINLIKNKENLGAYNNKFKAIISCKNEIVYQIDSDNIIKKNIDIVLNKINSEFNKEYIYYPSTLKQFFYNYQYYFYRDKNIVRLSDHDKLIDSSIVADSIINDNQITLDKNIFWILNCGNFIVSKTEFENTMKEYCNNDNVPLAADALAISYLWLKSGKNILLKENLYHYHRKRNTSVSLTLTEESRESFSFFREKFKSL